MPTAMHNACPSKSTCFVLHATEKPQQANDTSCTDSATPSSPPHVSWIFPGDASNSPKSRLASSTSAAPTTSSAPSLLQCTSGSPVRGSVTMRQARKKKWLRKDGRVASKAVTTGVEAAGWRLVVDAEEGERKGAIEEDEVGDGEDVLRHGSIGGLDGSPAHDSYMQASVHIGMLEKARRASSWNNEKLTELPK